MRLLLCLLFVTSQHIAGANADEPAAYQAGMGQFFADMVARHGFDEAWLRKLLGEARYRQEVIDAIRRPWESKPWFQYRAIFLTEKRVAAGARFMAENRELLNRAQSDFGVPAEIVAAIVGVETNYGETQGRHRVIDALTTLGFAYPERAAFFRKELEELLLLSREERLDPLVLKGSYAGAMGMPQFIPSSYRAYAVDFDGDGKRDLAKSPADAIGSVANYLARHGWRAGAPVAVPARTRGSPPADIQVLEKTPAEPNLGPEKLKEAGIDPSEPIAASTKVSLIRLKAPEDQYWLGFTNFYVITRYNRSNLYAMAVYQLSREIRESYQAEDKKMAAGIFSRFIRG